MQIPDEILNQFPDIQPRDFVIDIIDNRGIRL
jgi:hypothetical protein